MDAVIPSPIVAAAGGSFLIESRTPDEIFTPEDLSDEQRQIAGRPVHGGDPDHRLSAAGYAEVIRGRPHDDDLGTVHLAAQPHSGLEFHACAPL